MTEHRPLIGVSCMNSSDRDGSALVAVRPTYLRAIEAAGGVPLLIHLTDDLAVARALYERCAGILLPGGDDVDPAHYGEERHPALGAVDPQRDAVELALARWARADRKPLLGICRGIQLINVALGGTLYQDIPAQLPGALDHRANTHTRQWQVLSHPIAVDQGSRLAGLLGDAPIGGNTMHHQSVRAVAPGLRVTAHAPDGVVEALEAADDHYLLAVQCHPEHLWAASEPRWQALFADFVTACRARA